ncbi:hypothetical protein [Desulforegula conservatrix]|uniref:hypothetical protein n=1 Tax=Desulforegula conservatrix TaxID=153026 RepID=UPI000687D7BB|nr:hypothetical protein [Desulforegula conservatrix]
MNTKILVLLVSTIFISSAALAGHLHPEKWYQNKWCDEQKGKSEVVLPDRTRCDCITDVNAVEFDFGKKWAEAIGQSLYYSLQTGKRAGVVLINHK